MPRLLIMDSFVSARHISVPLGGTNEREALGTVLAHQSCKVWRLAFTVSTPVRPEKQQYRTALQLGDGLRLSAQPFAYFKRRSGFSFQAQQVNIFLDSRADGSFMVRGQFLAQKTDGFRARSPSRQHMRVNLDRRPARDPQLALRRPF